MKVSTQDFRAAIRAAKKVTKQIGLADPARATATAREVLKLRCPNLSDELLADLAWQAVLASV